MDVDGARLDIGIMPPYRVEQALAREHPTGMFEKMLEQAEFGRPELHHLAAAPHLVADHVHFDIGIGQLLAGQARPHAAQHRIDPGDQFAWREGLGDIIVGAGFEAAHPVFLLAACRQHDDRHIGGVGTAPQPAAHLDPRQALDHPVEQHDIGRLLLGEQQRLLAIRRARDLEILAREMPFEQFGERRIVFHQQHLGPGHRHSPVENRLVVGR